MSDSTEFLEPAAPGGNALASPWTAARNLIDQARDDIAAAPDARRLDVMARAAIGLAPSVRNGYLCLDDMVNGLGEEGYSHGHNNTAIAIALAPGIALASTDDAAPAPLQGIEEPPTPAGPDDYGVQADAPVAVQPLEFINPADWDDQPVPAQRWLARDRIPAGNVSLLGGPGASGKTQLALQLAVATVREADWIGSLIECGGPAIFFTAEEPAEEIHRRLDAICRHHQIRFADLRDRGLHVLCLPEEDCTLGAVDGRERIRPTPLFHRLCASIERIRPALVVIESAADVFGGNENSRPQVRQFIGLLRRPAMSTGAAVLLLSHPSLSGLNSGTGTSGSTGWNNSVRSRLYFAAPAQRESGDGKGEDDHRRELIVKKANYGPGGEVVRVRWERGVYVPQLGLSSPAAAAAQATTDAKFLTLLDRYNEQHRYVGDRSGRNYAPAVFAADPDCAGISGKAFASSMQRLFHARRLELETYGPPSRNQSASSR